MSACILGQFRMMIAPLETDPNAYVILTENGSPLACPPFRATLIPTNAFLEKTGMGASS